MKIPKVMPKAVEDANNYILQLFLERLPIVFGGFPLDLKRLTKFSKIYVRLFDPFSPFRLMEKEAALGQPVIIVSPYFPILNSGSPVRPDRLFH